MKKLIFAIAFLVSAQFSFAQFNASGYDLKGNVKFVQTSIFEYVEKFGETEVGNFFGKRIMQFNENGLIIKKYSVQGDKDSRDTSEIITYEYVSNEKGQIKEVNEYKQYSYSEPKVLKFKTKYKFNEEGKAIQGIKYNGYDGSFHNGYRYIYTNGEFSSSQAINSDGTDNEYGYNEEELNEDELSDYFEYDAEDVTQKDILDDKGNWIKRVVFKGSKQERGLERKIIYY